MKWTQKNVMLVVVAFVLLCGLVVLVLWIAGTFRHSPPKPPKPKPPGPVEIHFYNFTDSSKVDDFLADFTFDTDDLNKGSVKYVADNTKKLVSFENKQMIIKPGDIVNQKIESVKLVSKLTIKKNTLIAFKASHIPGNWDNPKTTPSWPAFWLRNKSGEWGVDAGEIDIYESINGELGGFYTTQHTFAQCTMDGHIQDKSTSNEANCNKGPDSTHPNIGCGVQHNNDQSARSGTFACVWQVVDDSTGSIDFFWWPYDDTNVGAWDISPDVTQWDNAKYASFKFGPQCSVTHFNDFNLVINTNFCGEWSGGQFTGGKVACEDAVNKISLEDKKNLEWRFDSIRILKLK